MDISINMDYCKLPKNANVVTAGDEGDRFFIVLSGKVSVWVHVSDIEMKKIFDLIKKKIFDQRMPWDGAQFDLEFVSDGRETKNQRLLSPMITEQEESEYLVEDSSSSQWESSVSNSDSEPAYSAIENQKKV
jgi:hypothetical protein